MISISLRALVNMESLNGIESVGNLSRHRVAPMVVKGKDGNYQVRYVPVVSGESIGHGYQECLAKVSEQLGLKVSERSKRGEFVKFAEKKYFDDETLKEPRRPEDARKFEVQVLLRDVVADVGGFLYTGNVPVKRTSRVQVGYMIPAADALESAAIEAQFHVRHVPSEPPKRQLTTEEKSSPEEETKEETRAQLGQMPYNVEVGSALYTFSIVLDVERIAVPSIMYGSKTEEERELDSQAPTRRKASILALLQLLSGFSFGAKKGRFLPNAEVVSAIASVSDPNLFVVSPGNSANYISETYERSEKFKQLSRELGLHDQKVELVYLDREKFGKYDGLQQSNSIDEMVRAIAKLEGLG